MLKITVVMMAMVRGYRLLSMSSILSSSGGGIIR